MIMQKSGHHSEQSHLYICGNLLMVNLRKLNKNKFWA